MIGVLIFLLLLLVAVQVIYNLYAASAVTAAAFDGARLAAGSDAGPNGRADAAAHVVSVLGDYGSERVTVTFEPDPDDVVLRVVAENPSFLPVALRRPLGFDTIDRTVRVRIERDR